VGEAQRPGREKGEGKEEGEEGEEEEEEGEDEEEEEGGRKWQATGEGHNVAGATGIGGLDGHPRGGGDSVQFKDKAGYAWGARGKATGLDWFTVDLREELSALHSPILEEQALFVARAVEAVSAHSNSHTDGPLYCSSGVLTSLCLSFSAFFFFKYFVFFPCAFPFCAAPIFPMCPVLPSLSL